jgi:hypothetical protein
MQTKDEKKKTKTKKEPKLKVRDLKPTKDAKGGEPPDVIKPPIRP